MRLHGDRRRDLGCVRQFPWFFILKIIIQKIYIPPIIRKMMSIENQIKLKVISYIFLIYGALLLIGSYYFLNQPISGLGNTVDIIIAVLNFLVVFSVLLIIEGILLLKSNFTKITFYGGIVLSVISLLLIPIGTILGIINLVLFIQGKKLFK